MAKEAYLVCASVKRDLFIWQRRPISMAKRPIDISIPESWPPFDAPAAERTGLALPRCTLCPALHVQHTPIQQCVCVCLCVVCVCVRARACACVCVCARAHTHTCMRLRAHTRTHMSTCYVHALCEFTPAHVKKYNGRAWTSMRSRHPAPLQVPSHSPLA